MNLYFDKAGQPIDRVRWSELLNDPSYRVIDQTVVGGAMVSTVWLGLNHGFNGPELRIFETMNFPEQDKCQRYATEAEARSGHAAMVEELKGAAQ